MKTVAHVWNSWNLFRVLSPLDQGSRVSIYRFVQKLKLRNVYYTHLWHVCAWVMLCDKSLFSSLTLGHFKKHGSGYSKFCQVYSHCNSCTRCHRPVASFVEVSFLHTIPLFERFPLFQAQHLPQLLEAPRLISAWRSQLHVSAVLNLVS